MGFGPLRCSLLGSSFHSLQGLPWMALFLNSMVCRNGCFGSVPRNLVFLLSGSVDSHIAEAAAHAVQDEASKGRALGLTICLASRNHGVRMIAPRSLVGIEEKAGSCYHQLGPWVPRLVAPALTACEPPSSCRGSAAGAAPAAPAVHEDAPKPPGALQSAGACAQDHLEGLRHHLFLAGSCSKTPLLVAKPLVGFLGNLQETSWGSQGAPYSPDTSKSRAL